MDSTLTLIAALREAGEGGEVVAVSFSSNGVNDWQRSREADARDLFVARMMGRDSPIGIGRVAFKRFDLSSWAPFGVTSVPFAGQAPLWVSALALVLAPGDNLWLGYNFDDWVWHYRHELVDALQAVVRLNAATTRGEPGRNLFGTITGDAPLSVRFPIEFSKRLDVVASLVEFGVPVDCVWWCDNGAEPSKKPCMLHSCGKCSAVMQCAASPEVASWPEGWRAVVTGDSLGFLAGEAEVTGG